MGLSGWSLLGALVAAFVGFGTYMYGGLDTSSANQAGVGKYILPELEAAQPKQQSGGPSQSTNNSSSGTEAPSQTLSSEGAPPILTGSGSAIPTETPSMGDTITFSKTATQPPLGQAASISTPVDSCTSQIRCAGPAQRIPNQDNVTPKDARPARVTTVKTPVTRRRPKRRRPKRRSRLVTVIHTRNLRSGRV